MHLLLCRESHQALVLQLNLQWVLAGHDNLEAHIELKVIHQQWICDLLAHDDLRPVHNFSLLVSQINAFSLRTVGWLDYPPLLRVFVHIVEELAAIGGQNVGRRHKVLVESSIVELHSLQVLKQVVLAGEFARTREVVDALVPLQPTLHAAVDARITPNEERLLPLTRCLPEPVVFYYIPDE